MGMDAGGKGGLGETALTQTGWQQLEASPSSSFTSGSGMPGNSARTTVGKEERGFVLTQHLAEHNQTDRR